MATALKNQDSIYQAKLLDAYLALADMSRDSRVSPPSLRWTETGSLRARLAPTR